MGTESMRVWGAGEDKLTGTHTKNRARKELEVAEFGPEKRSPVAGPQKGRTEVTI